MAAGSENAEHPVNRHDDSRAFSRYDEAEYSLTSDRPDLEAVHKDRDIPYCMEMAT